MASMEYFEYRYVMSLIRPLPSLLLKLIYSKLKRTRFPGRLRYYNSIKNIIVIRGDLNATYEFPEVGLQT